VGGIGRCRRLIHSCCASAAAARALIEHLEPYREAVERTADVWQYVSLLSASVTPLGGKLTAEIALAATWDEEHTLGARFEGQAFVKLNGSILPEY
jgi:hypothetical protein